MAQDSSGSMSGGRAFGWIKGRSWTTSVVLLPDLGATWRWWSKRILTTAKIPTCPNYPVLCLVRFWRTGGRVLRLKDEKCSHSCSSHRTISLGGWDVAWKERWDKCPAAGPKKRTRENFPEARPALSVLTWNNNKLMCLDFAICPNVMFESRF